MKMANFAYGTILLVGWALSGCAPGIQFGREAITSPGQLAFNAYTPSQTRCFHCHNGDGLGSGRGPDLSTTASERTDAELRDAILKGPKRMPAYEGKISDKELDDMVQWIRERAGE